MRFWEPWNLHQLGFEEPLLNSWADLSAWETTFGVVLPITLSRALVVQNGGRLFGTEIDILPIQRFTTLERVEWAGELRRGRTSATDLARLICIGTAPGGKAVLDYRDAGEPCVRVIDPGYDFVVLGDSPTFDDAIRTGLRR
ncbi:MAG: hypothetical protein QM811_23065 [Pirellulales bacterium]